MTESHPHPLFAHGTLLDPQVQAALFGRTVPTTPASLTGHTAGPLEIADGSRNLRREFGGTVEGAVLHLTERELAAADAHAGDDFARRRVLLGSGEPAWAHLDARPLRPAARIVIVGDSIAYGRCDPQGGWAAHLAAAHIASNETGHRVFNLAIPGSTLADVAAQTPPLLAPRHPDTLVVAAGINDSAELLAAPDTTRDNLSHLADRLTPLAATALRHNARMVVVGPAWLDETRLDDYEGLRFTTARALALRAALRAWCEDNHIDFIDLWEPLRDRPHLFVDGVHPTPDGHKELFRHLST
ncbi:GDSL-type esterase/lipase family protein [Kitasatospora griseola]|uniref:GDSL-type esterase/lipase family protein n=1 Tax=Kitasatospora griseola TaxID=2064 RepID=UPI003807FCBE